MSTLASRVGAFVALLVLGYGAPAIAADDVTIAYHLSYKCPPSTETGPGSSPEKPIALEAFDEAWRAAVDASEDDSAKSSGISSYECKWVKLSGFFRWTDYYDYRGRLYRSANGYYFDRDVSYLIEDFADPAARRSELQATQIEIVGQFYQLCAHAPGADMVFGPCHYGGHQGMMLNDVRILSIAGDRFQVLTGEANRPIVGDLVEAPETWSERAAVIAQAQVWLRALRSGRDAYERALQEEEMALKRQPLKQEDVEKMLAPDSWIGTLLDRERSRLLHQSRSIDSFPVRVFLEADEMGSVKDEGRALVCFCLEGACKDKWPLLSGDAERLPDPFLCIEVSKLDRKGGPPAWTWD